MAETSASRTAQSGMVTGLFPDRESAERAYGSVVERGYGQDDVNLVMSDETRKKHFAVDDRETELGNKALEGAGTGAAIGGTVEVKKEVSSVLVPISTGMSAALFQAFST